MRYETVTNRIGEYLGPIDWNYDFAQHNWGPNHGGINPELSRKLDWLRELEANPQHYQATTDGGWPKIGWKRVVQVGMYDGWPFWKPVPSVQIAGTLGCEWHSWYSITAIERLT
jgi:hypothetical protein